MSKIKQTPEFDSYQTFYQQEVLKMKKDKPGHIRLDGKEKGSNRKPFAYFNYQGLKWKVDADTRIDKLDIGFKVSQNSTQPFLIRPTRQNKNQCLVIEGEPLTPKRFYVYQTNSIPNSETDISNIIIK